MQPTRKLTVSFNAPLTNSLPATVIEESQSHNDMDEDASAAPVVDSSTASLTPEPKLTTVEGGLEEELDNKGDAAEERLGSSSSARQTKACEFCAS